MSITKEAKEIVHGELQQDYGSIGESFKHISGLWSDYLGIEVSSLDVAKMDLIRKLNDN